MLRLRTPIINNLCRLSIGHLNQLVYKTFFSCSNLPMNESTSRAKAGKWANSASPYCDVAVLEQFEPTIRSTDVFLSTFPKCGTTLVQNLLYQLREGGDPNLDCIYNHVPWLEYPVDEFSTKERLKHYAERKGSPAF